MFGSLLIANRGEIACRVIRTARRLGLETIAVYSDADADALHVRQAHRREYIGAAAAAQSYLNIDAVLAAAERAGAEAIHPGYGFLSENADFADACEAAGRIFVGPTAAAIRAMGSKTEAKRRVAAAGAPVVPGYHGDDQSLATLAAEADRIGYPLLVKAALGGGGRGMRVVTRSDDLEGAVAGARREAKAAFGDDTVLLERYLTAPKHIEVQLLADTAGKTLHLFERDCSVQRRHQKVIEEAPGPTVEPAMRKAMGEAAVRAARAIDYRGAGTVEFIAEDGEFHFMEMNTRLQVEHPVTELAVGVRLPGNGGQTQPLDLVEWQLRIAAGEPLPFDQDDLVLAGHAVEARVYAENPRRRFLPSSGRLARVAFGSGARVDTGVEAGSEVTVHYDPMLAKVIGHGRDRREAVARLADALRQTELVGVEHNVAYLLGVLDHPDFRAGSYTTRLAEDAPELVPGDDPLAAAIATVARTRPHEGADPWTRRDGFQLNLPHEQALALTVGRRKVAASIVSDDAGVVVTCTSGNDSDAVEISSVSLDDGAFRARVRAAARVDAPWRAVEARLVEEANTIYVSRGGATERVRFDVVDAAAFGTVTDPGGRIVAPMPGQVISVAVQPGDSVEADQQLLVLEAMKMEHNLRSPASGTVAAVHCAPGDRVEEGVELVVLEA